jgi:molybdopterin-biosynthesis enzyme MoeA-like protein
MAEIGREPNEARMRMARLPEGAVMIPNRISRAPGFRIGNVFVLAGVPKIMAAMLDEVGRMVEPGSPMLSWSVVIEAPEGDIAGPLRAIQERFPSVIIGSYPREFETRFTAAVVLRSRDQALLDQAAAEVEALAMRLSSGERQTNVWT